MQKETVRNPKLTARPLFFQEKVITSSFLLAILQTLQLVDSRTEIGGISPKGNVQALQKSIHAI